MLQFGGIVELPTAQFSKSIGLPDNCRQSSDKVWDIDYQHIFE